MKHTPISMARKFSTGTVRLACAVLALSVISCGKGKDEDAIAAAPIEACVVSRKDGKRLVGAYLRQTKAGAGYAMFSVTGKARRSGLPRNLAFDDRKIRRIGGSADGPLTGNRKSTATPRSGFAATKTLPAVYDLDYRAAKIDYTGPIVVGTSAAGFEIPTTGKITYSGKVQLALNMIDSAGDAVASTAEGQFAATVGYGSRRAQFTVSDLKSTSGPEFPFATLIWHNLGQCGTRVVSSGQGSVKMKSLEGWKINPFAAGRAPTPLRSSFESAQFARADRPGPPDRFGGVFLIEADAGTISAVFLSDSSP